MTPCIESIKGIERINLRYTVDMNATLEATDTTRTTISITRDTRKRLKVLAANRGQTIGDLVDALATEEEKRQKTTADAGA